MCWILVISEGQKLIADTGSGVISSNTDVPAMMQDIIFPGLEEEINNNAVYIRYSAPKII